MASLSSVLNETAKGANTMNAYEIALAEWKKGLQGGLSRYYAYMRAVVVYAAQRQVQGYPNDWDWQEDPVVFPSHP